jgi:GNAT superfamily N-acetyltransferase
MDTIRALEADDWDRWLPLWRGYLAFYRAELGAETTKAAFDRLCAGDDGMFGYIAVDEAATGRGIAHCIVHATTWSRRPTCYLQDLFVSDQGRGTGLGRALLEQAKRGSEERGARQLYWHTQQYNGPARSLYDQVGRPTSFVVYEA